MEAFARRVEVIDTKSCSKLRVEFNPSRRCHLSSATTSSRFQPPVRSARPFSGLIICVTGLSKEARKQVKEATEKLGGEYSSLLNSLCTHLVVQSYDGRKFEHALKQGRRDSLHIVTLGWFVDSVRRNVKLCESLYTVKSPKTESKDLALSGYSVFIDPDISDESRRLVSQVSVEGGAKLMSQWFSGCNASHVVCEAASVRRYLGHSSHLVSPLWLQKTLDEKPTQTLVRMSVDLARDLRTMLENVEKESCRECVPHDASTLAKKTTTCKERQKIVESAKMTVANRHAKMSKTLIQPSNLSSLLDSVCWTISEPTSTANVFIENFDNKTNDSLTQSMRLLTISERMELVYKNHFITLLLPIDWYGEMGPSSRSYFSETGFTCQQILQHMYAFYQENMSEDEIRAAVHTNSRHGKKLRAANSVVKGGKTIFKRIEFLGSRNGFEMLRRVSSFNCSNVYELIIKSWQLSYKSELHNNINLVDTSSR